MSVQGKTAIVTGSAGGLGRDIANMFLTRGANVVICDINKDRLQTVAAEYKTSHPNTVLVTEVNVADEDSVRDLIGVAVEKFGKVDIVVNNAGIMDKFDPAGSCDKKIWDAVLAVNLTGPFLVTKHAVAQMEKQRSQVESEGDKESGLIVNIGSNASYHGLAGGVAYSASKHGILALTKNTAGMYGSKGIHSVALLLGGMENTNIVDAFAQGINMEGMAKMQSTQPGARMVPTDHVASYIGFLSEHDMARSANGSCIVLNANWPEA